MSVRSAQEAVRRDMKRRVPEYERIPGVDATVPLSLYLDLLAKYDALVAKMIDLKRDNFNPEPAPPSQDDPGLALPSVIAEAIAARSVDSPSRRTLEAFARRKLALNEDHQEIAAAVLAGENLEDG